MALGTKLSTFFPHPCKLAVMKTIEGYQVTFGPITSHLEQKLGSETYAVYLRLYEEIPTNPKKACRELERLCQEHPDLPEMANLLSYIYIRLKDLRKAETLIRETYEKHPTYLFARINYADQCLRKKQIDLAASAFDHTFDLKALYPERKTFHESEFRGFMVCMGFYHLAVRQPEKARHYYSLAKEIHPDHRTVKALEKKIFKTSRLKKLARFFRIP
jgi:tetratricopeptide (TPR) repeat protein